MSPKKVRYMQPSQRRYFEHLRCMSPKKVRYMQHDAAKQYLTAGASHLKK